MTKTFEKVIEDLKEEERKDELTASPVEHRVMRLAFMAECVKKFERKFHVTFLSHSYLFSFILFYYIIVDIFTYFRIT